MIQSATIPDRPPPRDWELRKGCPRQAQTIRARADIRQWKTTATRLQTTEITTQTDLTTLNRKEIFLIDDEMGGNRTTDPPTEIRKMPIRASIVEHHAIELSEFDFNADGIIEKSQLKTLGGGAKFWAERQELAKNLGISGDIEKITPPRTTNWISNACEHRRLILQVLRG